MKAILFDLSGVLYNADQVIDGAIETIAHLQQSELQIRFITNTSQKTRQRILDDLHVMGFVIQDDQLYTATDVAKRWLVDQRLRPYCLVHRNIRSEFAGMDQSNPNGVLIGDVAEDFTFGHLNRAFQLCQQGAVLAITAITAKAKRCRWMRGHLSRRLNLPPTPGPPYWASPVKHFFNRCWRPLV